MDLHKIAIRISADEEAEEKVEAEETIEEMGVNPNWNKIKTEYRDIIQQVKDLRNTVKDENTAELVVAYESLLQSLTDLAKWLDMGDVRTKLKTTINEFG